MSELRPTMPPVDKTPPVNSGSFELINGIHVYNKIPVFEYRSKDTGLTVLLAETEGPIVNGFFCLATEAFDDDGLPHTLEHLVFLGSEKYPYKGVLDLLANRCLASGTNACTDTDNTFYTMENAGSEGFLAMMPIFLDHILYPILTDEGFITEVHHVTPEGDDAGVVYCEMQGRENSAESRLYLNLARALYPGHCGYSSETGGIMKNLRESTNNEKVREYHKQFYRPENVKIIITGQVNHSDVFKALQPVEETIISKGDRGEWTRPWQNPVPPLLESKDLLVKYPTDEENNGLFCIGWRGPSAIKEQYSLTAVAVLLKYLTDFPTYTLPKEFVEIDDPFASSIAFNFLECAESCIYLLFQGAPVPKLALIKPKLQSIFKEIVAKNAMNMERLHSIIKRRKLEHLSDIENRPADTISAIIISYILYGYTKEDFVQRANPLDDLNKLLQEPLSFWVSLLNKQFVENKYVTIQCIPSVEEHTKMAEEEAARIKQQIEALGPEGLAAKAKALDDAVEFNGKEPPQEMLTSLAIPSIEDIKYHSIIQFRSDTSVETERSTLDLSNTEVYTYFDQIKSEFVYLYAFLDTQAVPEDLRIYLPLLLEIVFESPIRKSGKVISYEEVVEELNNDVVSFASRFGLGSAALFKTGPFSQTVSVTVQVEALKYAKGVEWLKNVLFNTVFDVDRIKIIAHKMNNAVAEAKRNGRNVVAYAMQGLRYQENSNVYNNGVLKQSRFLSEIIPVLESDKFADVLVTLEKIWGICTESKHLVLHFMGDLGIVKDVLGPLKNFVPKNPERRALQVTPNRDLLKASSLDGCIIGMGCLESSFFYQTVESIANPEDPDLAALMLYLTYLIQMEGPMWRQIRGKGYSYGYTMTIKPDEGLLYLAFGKATNVVGAYVETKQIILHQVKEKEWDQTLLEAARSSLSFELIDEEKTITSMIALSVFSNFQNVDFEHNRRILKKIHEVTIEDLNAVGVKYLLPLFDPKRVKTAVVCVPAKMEQIQEAFKSMDLDLTAYPTLEDSFLK